MKKKILIACDLEGVNNVSGEPYTGLVKGCAQWDIARHQAAREINAASQRPSLIWGLKELLFGTITDGVRI